MMAACGQSTLTTVVPESSREQGDATAYFQDGNGNIVGEVFVRSGSSAPDGYVPFLVEIPIVPDQDYRLNSFTLEFTSEMDLPSIFAEPSGDLLNGMEFSRTGRVVRLSVPNAGSRGESTVLVRFLAEKTAFSGGGLQLNATLKLKKGTGEASLMIKPTDSNLS
jgi:hypothetical protein